MKNNNNTFMKSEFTISILILLLNFFIIICTDSFLEQLSIAYIVLFLISLYLFAFFFKEKLLYNFALNTILYFFLIIFISNIINIIMNIEQFILVLYGYKLYYIILNCFLFLSLFLQIIYFLLININKILKRILILISFLLFFILLIWFFYLFFNYLIVALDNQ